MSEKKIEMEETESKVTLSKTKKWLLSHWKLIFTGLLIIGIGYTWYTNKNKTQLPDYIIETATKRDIIREVSVNGRIMAKESRDLFSTFNEKVTDVLVEEGQIVLANQELIRFNDKKLKTQLNQAYAQLNQARAALNQQLAGATDSEIALAQKDVESARISLEASKDVKNTNLKDAMEKAFITYRAAWTELKEARIIVNSVVKFDRTGSEINRYANTNFGDKHSILKNKTKNDYQRYKIAVNNFSALYQADNQSVWDSTEEALFEMKSLGELMKQGMQLTTTTAKMVSYTINPSQIDLARGEVMAIERTLLAQSTLLQSAIQSVEAAQLSIRNGTLQNDSFSQAEADVTLQRVALEKARTALTKVSTGPRDVDIGVNKAAVQIAENQVAQVKIALEEATIMSPIDGMITLINAKSGEHPNSTIPLVIIKSPALEIMADISESDIADVEVGKKAHITFDAFSRQDIYTATVVKKAKSETMIQGVVYYRVTLELEPEQEHDLDRVLSGMTADIELQIDTRKDVYALEPQSLIYQNGIPHIRILTEKDGEKMVEERPVKLGLEGNTYVEIIEGINGGESIILYEDLGTRSPF